MRSKEERQRVGRRLVRASTIVGMSVVIVIVAFASFFQIQRFKSITDFAIVNRLTGSRCEIPWSQEMPACSDAIANFVDQPFMRIFAAEVAVSDWRDLQLHQVNLSPQKCAALRVRHTLSAFGIEKDAGFTTQTVWLTDGGVYTVAGTGLTAGDTATICVGISKANGSLRLTLQSNKTNRLVYTDAFIMPVTPRRHWWWETR